MSPNEFRNIVANIKYKDWYLHREERMDSFVLQWRFIALDSATGVEETQHGRKWFVSIHSCRAEIVRTAYKAALAAEEHEVQENFKYRGHVIHSPHLDPDAIVRWLKSTKKVKNVRRKQ